MITYEQEFQKAIDACLTKFSEAQIDNMTAYEIQYQYGKILAADLLRKKPNEAD